MKSKKSKILDSILYIIGIIILFNLFLNTLWQLAEGLRVNYDIVNKLEYLEKLFYDNHIIISLMTNGVLILLIIYYWYKGKSEIRKSLKLENPIDEKSIEKIVILSNIGIFLNLFFFIGYFALIYIFTANKASSLVEMYDPSRISEVNFPYFKKKIENIDEREKVKEYKSGSAGLKYIFITLIILYFLLMILHSVYKVDTRVPLLFLFTIFVAGYLGYGKEKLK